MSADTTDRGGNTSRVALERQVGSMVFSELEAPGPISMVRAIAWFNTLVRLGQSVPLVVVHDMGCVLASIGQPGTVAQGTGDPRAQEAWRCFLVELTDTEIARAHASWKHNDSMIGIVLSKVLRSIVPHLPSLARNERASQLPVDLLRYARIDPNAAQTRHPQAIAQAWVTTLCRHKLGPLLEIEQVDIDALRLLSLFKGGGNGSNADDGLDLADMYNVIQLPAAADVIDFSLELLPSLLEVKRGAGQQTFGMDGYAAIERVGHLDNLVLSQLAFDDELLEQKYVDQELFYYTHEAEFEHEERHHLVLIDGSASMRGVKEVFARGLGLALCKRLSLLGEDVTLNFFDSRLYEGVKVRPGSNAEVPYALQFRSEHGRNYTEVIRELNARLSTEKSKGAHYVYFLTHGECQFPAEEVQLLSTQAALYGVFILPHAGVELGYLDHLQRVHVIDEQAMSHVQRANKARQIIQSVETDLADSDRSTAHEVT